MDISRVVALDIETDHNGAEFYTRNLSDYTTRCRIRTIQLGFQNLTNGIVKTHVFDLWHESDEVKKQVANELARDDTLFIGVNLRNFDVPILRRHGFVVPHFLDVDEMSQLYYHSVPRTIQPRHGLNFMLKRELNKEKYIMEDDYNEFASELPLSIQTLAYCHRDVEYLHELFYIFMERFESSDMLEALLLDQEVGEVIAKVQQKGMYVDVEGMTKFIDTKVKWGLEQEEEIREVIQRRAFGIRKDSSRQYFVAMELPVPMEFNKSNATYKFSTSDEAMAGPFLELNEEQRDIYRHFKSVRKAVNLGSKSNYTISDENSRIHFGFNASGAATTRMSSRAPNGQQIPRELREFFRAAPGTKLVVADLGQIEPRFLALLTGDQTLLAACESDEDFYISVACFADPNLISLTPAERKKDVFNENHPKVRDQIKVYFLAGSYGGGAYNLVKKTAIDSLNTSPDDDFKPEVMSMEEARRITRLMDETFIERSWNFNRSRVVSGMTHEGGHQMIQIGKGYRRAIRGSAARKGYVSPNEILNTPVQGIAAVHLKLALRRMLMDGSADYLVNIVHDEVVCEVPEDEAEDFARLLPLYFQDALMDLSDSLDLSALKNPRKFITMDTIVCDEWEKP